MPEAVKTAFVTAELPRLRVAPEPSSVTAPVADPSPFGALPVLKPLPQTGRALVAVQPQTKARFWQSWFEKKPEPPADPGQSEAQRAWAQSHQLAGAIKRLHDHLGNNTALLNMAPNNWEELVTPYIVARASAVAMLASTKTVLDDALEAGATAAIDFPSRSTFQRTVDKIRAADSECAALMSTAQSRHGEAKAEAARVQKAKDDIDEAQKQMRSRIKDLTPAQRKSLEERIAGLKRGGYGFAPRCYDDPNANKALPWPGLAPEGVIPTLVLNGGLVFGTCSGNDSGVPLAGSKPIASLEDLVELVDSLMGRGAE